MGRGSAVRKMWHRCLRHAAAVTAAPRKLHRWKIRRRKFFNRIRCVRMRMFVNFFFYFFTFRISTPALSPDPVRFCHCHSYSLTNLRLFAAIFFSCRIFWSLLDAVVHTTWTRTSRTYCSAFNILIVVCIVPQRARTVFTCWKTEYTHISKNKIIS